MNDTYRKAYQPDVHGLRDWDLRISNFCADLPVDSILIGFLLNAGSLLSDCQKR